MRVKVKIKDEDLKCEDTLSLEGRSGTIWHSRSVFQTLSCCPVVENVEISEYFNKTFFSQRYKTISYTSL